MSDFIAEFTDNFWGVLNYNLCNGVIETNKQHQQMKPVHVLLFKCSVGCQTVHNPWEEALPELRTQQ